jgi:hypothetical protein
VDLTLSPKQGATLVTGAVVALALGMATTFWSDFSDLKKATHDLELRVVRLEAKVGDEAKTRTSEGAHPPATSRVAEHPSGR